MLGTATILLGLTLTVEPVKKEVTLGEPIELKVMVEHDGKGEAVEKGPPPLVIDDQVLQLTIGQGAGQFVYTRHKDAGREFPIVEYTKERSNSGTVSFTPVRSGDYPIEVSFMGGKASGSTQVKVKPAADGSTELGMLFITSKGEMKLRFFPEVAPNHVAHFAERVRLGFYDGLVLHRVIKKFMAQGGDPSGNGSGGPGYSINAEFTNDRKYTHSFGRLSTARTNDPNSAGSQFFLCFDEATFLDGKYTVLGEVFEGQPTLRKIEEIGADRDPQKPRELVKIERAALVPIPAPGAGAPGSK